MQFNDELEKLSAHIAIFLDSEKTADIEGTKEFLRSQHDHNIKAYSDVKIHYDPSSSNSSYKDKLRDVLGEVTNQPINVVPIQNFRGLSVNYAKNGILIVFERLKKFSAAIIYGLNGTMVEALERNGVILIEDEEIEVSISSSPNRPAEDGKSVIRRQEVPQLIHSNTVNPSYAHSKSVRVAVIDTGLDVSHQEFSGSDRQILHFGYDEKGDLTECPPSEEACYHGTQVCSVLAGKKIGVLPNSDLAVCAIMKNKAPGVWSYRQRDLYKAVSWLLKGPFEGGAKPDVINFSFGQDQLNSALKAQIKRLADDDRILCFAATCDNGSTTHCPYPANFDATWVLSVGSVDTSNAPLPTSNYDTDLNFASGNPNFACLGTGIKAAYPNGAYSSENGSSFSSAIAAGIAGIVISRATTHSKTDVVEELKKNTVQGTDGIRTGSGVLRLKNDSG